MLILKFYSSYPFPHQPFMSSLFFPAPSARISTLPSAFFSARGIFFFQHGILPRRRSIIAEASNEVDAPAPGDSVVERRDHHDDRGSGERIQPTSEAAASSPASQLSATSAPSIKKDIKKVVQKTASTFAPRASSASKNPAVPGTALYTVFEVQGYASMLIGGALSFNLVFSSNEPDIWRLMGMWSIWMFTIPSLRARDCSKNEKEALNYLFLLIPLLNVLIPFFYKSFAVVWSADTFAFFVIYAWKLGWIQRTE